MAKPRAMAPTMSSLPSIHNSRGLLQPLVNIGRCCLSCTQYTRLQPYTTVCTKSRIMVMIII